TTVVDDYFGVKIADPYRWLEDDNSEETAEWVKQQNKLTYDYLGKIPQREAIKTRLAEVWNYEKQSTPWRKGPYVFFYNNDGVQNQSVLHYMDTASKEVKILMDPNTFSEDGTTSLGGLSLSDDAKYAAYMISKAGSDWKEVFVIDIATGKLLEDHIKWVKFSGMNWQEDGFYYARYDAPQEGDEFSASNLNHKVYYHRLGTAQADDQLIMEDSTHPKWNFGISTSDDGAFEFLWISESTSGYQLALRKKGETQFTYIDTTFNHEFSIVDNVGDMIYMTTNVDAPKNRLVAVDVNNPSAENWKEIIPEQESVLNGVSVLGDKFIAQYLVDVSSKLSVYTKEGESLGDVQLPGFGIVGSFNSSGKSAKAYYSFENYTTPMSVYELDIQSMESKLYWQPKIDFNPSDYQCDQVFFTSKDGTKIPMFITYKKGMERNGNNPTFLYGYGGFNISIKPKFNVENTVFLENGGIYCVANMRGGGEYGEEWHKAGTKLQKQNVFDDFIGAAEYLIAEKYTNSEKLAVHGRSNGGLLIGAVMTQRPDLYKVCLPKVGVLDMLRYQNFTIGRAWAVDYGLSENEEEFNYLLGYSPLHNVKAVEYPATMVQTGDHDDRVVPAHSFKFAATLQEKNTGDNPMLIRIDVNAGHGAGKPVSMQIDEFGDTWAFVFHHLGMSIETKTK
ncbi:prolyl oligopeptidase family serine peptidase, partial [Flavobacteriales bacterium]|nr:prolyl oligopeptidase family serine peptidase [Flavobacteriales bacterium]